MTLLAGASICLASFLLFLLEPLIAKRILPWFGGSSAVWSVCLVFYQVTLLVGYLYAVLLTRYLRPRQQAFTHIALLAACLALLPIGPTERWRPAPETNPTWLILLMLTATVGLPFALLSATSPLLQHWLARSGDKMPYRLFAWSNFASLAALLAYPLLIEPHSDGRAQSLSWSVAFVFSACLCAAFAWRQPTSMSPSEPPSAKTYLTTQPVYWFALSACASMLLLSITNQIDQNVAAVPLLWILPLAVYLLSFIVTFESRSIYRRSFWLRLLVFGLAIVAYAAYDITAVMPIQITIPVYLTGLFIGCVFCQGELYRLRPATSRLTSFYLAVALGGATGAIMIGMIAPQIFSGIYELPLSLAFTSLLALALTWAQGQWLARLHLIGVTALMIVVFVFDWQAYHENALALERSFYGSLRVLQSPDRGPLQARTLFHGTVQHGEEFVAPARRMLPTTYYGPDSGIGILLREWPGSPKSVGIVGLGAGTLAVYGSRSDNFRFYEINPQVVSLARKYFDFLSLSKARIEIIDGDARLSLERENGPKFNVLALDAFSGDAIPVHLLTREAMGLYMRRLQPDGALAFHVSNNYLDLAPVVRRLADAVGLQSMVIKNHSDAEQGVLASEWVLVTNNRQVLTNDALVLHSVKTDQQPTSALWTDNFNSLLPILKTPEFR